MNKHTAKLIGMKSSRYRLLREDLLTAIGTIPQDIQLEEINDIDDILNYSLNAIPAILIDDAIILDNGDQPTKSELLEDIYQEVVKHFPMKKILVPVDFSKNSIHAYHYAQRISEDTGSEISLIHFVHIFVDPNMPSTGNVNYLVEEAQKRLDHFASDHQLSFDKGKRAKLAAKAIIGFAAPEIVRMTEEGDIDLVVMGTKGSSSIDRRLFGSVSIKVAQEARRPVILVPPNSIYKGFKEVLFTSSKAAIDEFSELTIKQLKESFGAFSHLLHIKPDKQSEFHFDRVQLHDLDDESQFKQVQISCPSVLEGINEYIERHDIDLAIVTTKHRNIFEDLFHKSMTKQLAMNLRVPLMVLHPRK
ncbi:MAG: universal stress protein [Bacteroidota bacterium]